jgi:hypothetical protein
MDRDARHVGAGQVGDARAAVFQGYMAASCSCFWHQYTLLELSSKYDYVQTPVIEVLHVPSTSCSASIMLFTALLPFKRKCWIAEVVMNPDDRTL